LLLIDLHERKAKTFPHDELLPVEPRKASKKNMKDKNETMTLRDWLWR
jgi:hypothetical protein